MVSRHFSFGWKAVNFNFTSQNSVSLSRSFGMSPQYCQTNWVQAVSNGEKVVGYPTSFLSLRCLMSDEISNIAIYLKKLIGTGHPLLTTAKKLVYSQDKTHQTRGLLVLLVSKASNSNQSQDILPSQRSLAEITELIHTAHLIHTGVININNPNANLEMGNKMAILCGDFLLAHACVALAALKNVKIVELISQAISDISTAEFIDIVTENTNPMERWSQQTQLRYGTLLAHSCQSSLILGNNQGLLQCGHSLGLEIAQAWQASIELQNFITAKNRTDHVLAQLFPVGTSFNDIVSRFQTVRDKHVETALNLLAEFPKNDATHALSNIARALKY